MELELSNLVIGGFLAIAASALVYLTHAAVQYLNANRDNLLHQISIRYGDEARIALDRAIKQGVQAAQQMSEGNNQAKYDYVLGLAKAAAESLGLKFDEEQLRVLIESTVLKLKKELEQVRL